MDSSKFITRIRAIQDEAKQELINYLKAKGSSIEVPEDVDITDWAIDCKDGDDDNIFITGIRLNDNCELEFKAEYADSEREYGKGGWDALYYDNMISVTVNIETIYAFAVDTVARKSWSGPDTITVNNFREFLYQMKPSTVVLFEGDKYTYNVDSIQETQEGQVLLNGITDARPTASDLLEKLSPIDGDKPIYLNDDDDKILRGISTCYRKWSKEILVQLY